MKFKILARWSNEVRAEVEIADSFAERSIRDQRGEAIRQALKSGSDLSGCNLRDSDLRDSDLSGCNLRDSDLSGCNLSGCNLSGCNLSGCNLRDSDLRDSDLRDSDLSGCNLRDSDLRDSDLSGCNLSGCNLSGCNLSGCNLRGAKNLPQAALTPIRNDLWDVLLRARNEAPFLLGALRAGQIDGSTYEGACACLVGTIANGCGVAVDNLANDLVPDSGRPIERWFMAIKPGDTPDKSEVAKITEGWIVEFMKLSGIEVVNEAA
jgi:hypothetical protein